MTVKSSHTCIAYVSIRQHTPAYVSIRQHTSASIAKSMHTSSESANIGAIAVKHMRYEPAVLRSANAAYTREYLGIFMRPNARLKRQLLAGYLNFRGCLYFGEDADGNSPCS
jgi:hypothetical protein